MLGHSLGAPMSDANAKPPIITTRKQGLVRDFYDFLVHEKAWWLTPIIVVILALVAFILFAESSPVLPFIYMGV
jgi:hypothetical protein